MSSIQANDNDTSAFLTALTRISDQQRAICAQLDELLLLMQLPSESVLQVLRGLLLSMNSNIDVLATTLQTRLGEA